MGSCASLYRNSESALKVRLQVGSHTDKLVIPPSPIKDNQTNGNPPISNGSKEEAFFDSRPWLESDCEDFFSVNGDFTPSRGSTPARTPAWNSSSIGTPPGNRTPSNMSAEPSPTERRRKLADFLKDSLSDDVGEQIKAIESIQDLPTKFISGTLHASGTNSGCTSERVANGDTQTRKEKPNRHVQRCFLSLASCHRSSERRMKKMSPTMSPAAQSTVSAPAASVNGYTFN